VNTVGWPMDDHLRQQKPLDAEFLFVHYEHVTVFTYDEVEHGWESYELRDVVVTKEMKWSEIEVMALSASGIGRHSGASCNYIMPYEEATVRIVEGWGHGASPTDDMAVLWSVEKVGAP
jgi:hypothetical protein